MAKATVAQFRASTISCKIPRSSKLKTCSWRILSSQCLAAQHLPSLAQDSEVSAFCLPYQLANPSPNPPLHTEQVSYSLFSHLTKSQTNITTASATSAPSTSPHLASVPANSPLVAATSKSTTKKRKLSEATQYAEARPSATNLEHAKHFQESRQRFAKRSRLSTSPLQNEVARARPRR